MTSKNNNKFIPIPKALHNDNVKKSAEKYAKYMRENPSELEGQMMDFLSKHNIDFIFQKIFYIKSSGGFIKQYYIVDFYIPNKHIILEVDGKFHDSQRELDSSRSTNIQKHYPNAIIIRWNYKDFHSYTNMKKLLEFLK